MKRTLIFFISIISCLTLISTPLPVAATANAASQPAAAKPTLSFGDKGEAVKDLQRRLGGLEVDGAFGEATLDKVVRLQIKKGLVPDGIVGPQTWRFVLNQKLPAAGKSFVATGKARLIIDKRNNLAFLLNKDGELQRLMKTVDNNKKTRTGNHTLTAELALNKSAVDGGEVGEYNLYNYSRFYGAPPNSLGIHAIPVYEKSGKPLHGIDELGAGTNRVSSGCVRVSRSSARAIQKALTVGSSIKVVESMKADL